MYKDFFGLREHPFNVTPDPRFFYANPVYQEAYASLLLAIRGRKGFAVMTGEVGTGKTTLLRMLMDSLEATIRFAYVYNTRLSFDELLTYASDELGLPTEGGRLAKIGALNQFLIEQLRRGGTGVLLIDEAQDLDNDVLESLRLLSNLETSTEKLLQIILVGQPEFEAKLAQPSLRQLAQRVPVRCRLHPLSDGEVGRYIAARLRTAGYSGRDLFSEAAVQRIAVGSGGIPRLINILCDNGLQVAYATSKRTVSRAMIDEVIRELGPARPDVGRAAVSLAKTSPSSEDPNRGPRPTYPRRWPKLRAAPAGIGALVAGVAVAGTAALVSPPISLSKPAIDWADVSTGIRLLSERVSAGVRSLGAGRATADGQEPTTGGVGVDLPDRSYVASPGSSTSSPRAAQPQGLLVSAGATVGGIAGGRYGNHYLLGMDLIKEFNPHVDDLDWITTGDVLWLPPLNRETLIREPSNSAFEVVVGTHVTREAAESVARSPRRHGYEVGVTPRRITKDRILYRVTIVGLKTKKAADQAWEATVANCWNVTPAGHCERERDG
jgi:general secretion pathway protein A